MVPDGRLKLRQGNIENSLIFYQRPNLLGPKVSSFLLYHPASKDSDSLKKLLATALGEKIVVDKHRAIYFLDNVKFHVDKVAGLGDFVEIEVMDTKETGEIEVLQKQCEKYIELFEIERLDLVPHPVNPYQSMLVIFRLLFVRKFLTMLRHSSGFPASTRPKITLPSLPFTYGMRHWWTDRIVICWKAKRVTNAT